MKFFSQIFCKKQIDSNDSVDRTQDFECNKIGQQSFSARDINNSIVIQCIDEHHSAGHLVDQKINEEVELIRKSRFFVDFDRVFSSLDLARRLESGDFSAGSDAIRSKALAWCARLLAYTDELDKAEECLKQAKSLGSCPEITIAEAFINSQKDDKKNALSILADIGLPISRSAALMIVSHHDGAQVAVNWLKRAGIEATKLDSDGKFILLTLYLKIGKWEAAKLLLDVLTPEDLSKTPILHHMVAITYLSNTVPKEFRSVVLNQVPFGAAEIPLAADTASIDARREAHRHFIAAVEIAKQLNCPNAATISDEYALWLELKDPNESDKGKQRLKAKFHDPKSALRLVHLGLQIGIKLDLGAVEREIEQNIALHGSITYDAGIARFALALTQKTPKDVAKYTSRHYDELVKVIDKKLLQSLQVEMLSKAGMPEKAKECLDMLVEEDLSKVEESRLQRIIAEAEGTNPVEVRKEQFKETGSLKDLMALVDELETKGEWDELCKYGEILFERTQSLQDAERLAKALASTTLSNI